MPAIFAHSYLIELIIEKVFHSKEHVIRGTLSLRVN